MKIENLFQILGANDIEPIKNGLAPVKGYLHCFSLRDLSPL